MHVVVSGYFNVKPTPLQFYLFVLDKSLPTDFLNGKLQSIRPHFII